MIVPKDLGMTVINLSKKSYEGICHVRLERSIDEHAALCMKKLSLHSLQYCLNEELFSCCYNDNIFFTDVFCSGNSLWPVFSYTFM